MHLSVARILDLILCLLFEAATKNRHAWSQEIGNEWNEVDHIYLCWSRWDGSLHFQWDVAQKPIAVASVSYKAVAGLGVLFLAIGLVYWKYRNKPKLLSPMAEQLKVDDAHTTEEEFRKHLHEEKTIINWYPGYFPM